MLTEETLGEAQNCVQIAHIRWKKQALKRPGGLFFDR